MELIFDLSLKRRYREEYVRLEIYAPCEPIMADRYVAYLLSPYGEVLLYESDENLERLRSTLEYSLLALDYYAAAWGASPFYQAA